MPKHTVDHPAHRSVSAMDDDQVHAIRSGRSPEFGSVAAVVGVFDGELEAALERMGQQIAAGRCGGSGCWVHDQHGPHEA